MEREQFLSSVYILIKNEEDKILLQRRQGTTLWPNFLALPAGHIDKQENAIDAVIREAKEELDIKICSDDIVDSFVVNRRNKTLKPYYDVYFVLKGYSGTIKINEPEKCSEIMWADIDNLPSQMIEFEKVAIYNYLNGIKFSVIDVDDQERI